MGQLTKDVKHKPVEMKAVERRWARNLLEAIRSRGMILLQDGSLPNAVGLLAGETIRGSWWTHPAANQMYNAVNAVIEHREVLAAKLVGGKVTLLHRSLWPALLAVAMERADWQLGGLTAEASALLRRLDRGHTLESVGSPAQLMQKRLLAHAAETHTASGKHAIQLVPWASWAQQVGCTALESSQAARTRLEEALAAIGGRPALLPWNRRVRRVS